MFKINIHHPLLQVEGESSIIGGTNYQPLQTDAQNAEALVEKLEGVEEQFETIMEMLPRDCSEIQMFNKHNQGKGESGNEGNHRVIAGLYLLARPQYQQEPEEEWKQRNGSQVSEQWNTEESEDELEMLELKERRPLLTHCTEDGWTTVQRRYDGSADFNRSWSDYARGFGSPAGEFWIGNEQLHQLTIGNCSRLRVVMQDIYDNVWLAEYEHFHISSRRDGYRLYVSGYSGNATNALDYQQGMQFSAIDVDRDISQTHCAANYEGGWWFSHCQHANLNGRYNLGLTWFDATRNEWIAVKSSEMMVKPLAATSISNANNNCHQQYQHQKMTFDAKESQTVLRTMMMTTTPSITSTTIKTTATTTAMNSMARTTTARTTRRSGPAIIDSDSVFSKH